MRIAAPPAALLSLPIALCCAAQASAQASDPARVLVLYNSNFPDQDGDGKGDSLQVAEYYAARRGLPAANLLALPCSSATGYSSYTPFYLELRRLVQDRLNAIGPQSVDTLLLSYGMPYELTGTNQGTLSLDHALQRVWAMPTNWTSFAFTGVPNFYFDASPSIGADKAPFTHSFVSGGKDMYLAARLDGPNVHACERLIEAALYGERYLWNSAPYYTGHVYVDTRFKVYTDADLALYPEGHTGYAESDLDLAYGKNFALQKGWSLKWHNDASDLEIGEGASYQDGSSGLSAPQAMWYSGWYNFLKYQDVFEWLPGSVACDLDSLSLWDHRNPNQVSFGTQALANGLTCCSGVLAEPYTIGHPYGEVLLYYLFKGFTFAEAATVSDPKLQWVSLHIGDPLYRPMFAGKQPVLDTQTPPEPQLELALGPAGSSASVALGWTPAALAEPELAKAVLEYGNAGDGSFASATPPTELFDVHHSFALAGLAPNSLYDLRATLSDPVGNTRVGASWLLVTKQPAPIAAVAQGIAPAPAAGQPVVVRLGLAVQGGLAAGYGGQILYSHPGLGLANIDVTPLALAYANGVATGPQYESIAVRLAFPAGVLPPGACSLTLLATSQSQSASASVALLVP